jgi:hypothetical protein
MRNGVPLVYWVLRNVWSVVHIVLVLMAFAVLVWWLQQDSHGTHGWASAETWTEHLRDTVSGWVKYPWG